MSTNKHSIEEIEAFANEMLDLTNKNKEELLRRIEEFHAPNCTATERNKEKCLLAFSFRFLELLEQMNEQREMEKMYDHGH